MAKQKQSKTWDDPRNIRPAGWHPPEMTEKGYSRLFESFEGGQRKIIISGHLSNLYGTALRAYQCHLFYTDNLSPSILLGNYWSPWHSAGEVRTIIRALLPYIEPDIQEFCKIWLAQIQIFDELNQEWANALAKYFNRAIPNTEDDFQVLRNQVELYRKENGAAWTNLPEFQSLISQLDSTVIKMHELVPKLDELIKVMHSQFSPDDLESLVGDRKVEDQIDASREEPNHKGAINKLNRLFKENPSQIQFVQIYMELGFRHAELGEIAQAIENYTKSIDSAKLPNPMVYFWRGELYYRQKEWKKSLKDFEKTIELEIYSPEREKALQYISELQSK